MEQLLRQRAATQAAEQQDWWTEDLLRSLQAEDCVLDHIRRSIMSHLPSSAQLLHPLQRHSQAQEHRVAPTAIAHRPSQQEG